MTLPTQQQQQQEQVPPQQQQPDQPSMGGSVGNCGSQEVQRFIHHLMHACQCKHANCRLASCQGMKRVVTHLKTCKRRTSGACPICKRVVALCCHHGILCQEANCIVPFCNNIKRKLEQQRQRRRLQQAQLLRRRMAVVPNQQPAPILQQAPQLLQQQQQQQQQAPLQQQQQGQPDMGGMGAQMPRQPGVMGNPTGRTAAGKQTLLQLWNAVRKFITPQQRNQILHQLQGNPYLMACLKQRKIRRTGQQAGGAGPLSLDQSQPQQQQIQQLDLNMISPEQQQQEQQQPDQHGAGDMAGVGAEMPRQPGVMGDPTGQAGPTAEGK